MESSQSGIKHILADSSNLIGNRKHHIYPCKTFAITVLCAFFTIGWITQCFAGIPNWKQLEQVADEQESDGEHSKAASFYEKAAFTAEGAGIATNQLLRIFAKLTAVYISYFDFMNAEKTYHKIALIAERKKLSLNSEAVFSIADLADKYEHFAKGSKEEPFLKHAIFLRRLLSSNDRALRESLNKLAGYYCERGRFQESEAAIKQAMPITDRSTPESKALQSFSLGMIDCGLRKYPESRAAYKQAVELFQKSTSPVSRQLLGDTYRQIGSLCLEQSNFKKANEYFLKAKEIHASLFGNQCTEIAFDLLGLSVASAGQGHYQEAGQFARQNISMTEKLIGLQASQLVVPNSVLANILRKEGKYEESKKCEARAQSIRVLHKPWNEDKYKTIIDRLYWICPHDMGYPHI